MGSTEWTADRGGVHSRLKATDGGHQLLVRGKPFLARAAELQNSSLSCPRYMEEVWPKLVDANVNTVLGPVTWEVMEPKEGQFDFSWLDQVLLGARKHGLALILLWFGAYKNGTLLRTLTTVAEHGEGDPPMLPPG